MNESRVKKGLLNAKINFLFYFVNIIIAFFSRKIFLETLGAEFIGLSGTLQNILGMLSLAELGIGASVSFHLYKPIRESNYNELNDKISLFGWLYRIVGIFILVVGLIISLFFPIIFKDTGIHLPLIYFVFFSFLGSSLIYYFINYRQILLSADQKQYVVSVYLQTGMVVKTLVQMFCCYYFLNYYIWAIIEFLFAIVACIILNFKIDKTYPWLKVTPSHGKVLYKKYPSILTSTRQIFIHKLKDFLLGQSDQILIFAFVSLKYVAYYGNYSMLISRVTSLFTVVMNSAEAGVGNLVAEGDMKKIKSVFWELMSMRYLFAGIISVCLYFMIPPFIVVWLGSEYLLSPFVTFLICLNAFILMSRTAVDAFNHAYGQYADVWSAWAEGGTNLLVTIIVASQIGIAGILLGKIVSLFFFVILWKPYYLFSDGFHEKYWNFWKHTLKYYLCLLLSLGIVCLADEYRPMSPSAGWGQLIFYGLYICSIFSVFYFCILYFFSEGLKEFSARMFKQILKK